MKLLFEQSAQGKRAVTLRKPEVPAAAVPAGYARESLSLPELSEIEVVRHYTGLSNLAHGVDSGFYPLGSCTMKYNPKLNEEIAANPLFAGLHPLQSEKSAQGALEVIHTLSGYLAEITGMDAVSLQPNAGAHGEYTGLMLISRYHAARGDTKRTKILVPDSAHGTNPASASFAGYETVSIPSDAEYGVDLEKLRATVGDDTAALMLTNPTTLGLFEKQIGEIAAIVHGAGGLLYYDGANLNAVMGIVRPGDMGFDVVHLNLHKTFSTPHGGGGPGSGPVGCKKALAKFLPNPSVVKTAAGYRFQNGKDSLGKVSSFYGNFGVYLKAYAYILTLGAEGVKEAAATAVLNANYLKAKLADIFPAVGAGRHCMHEFVVSLQTLKEEAGVSAMDVAKSLIDYEIHPPTMYFPLTVREALMFEPTETESKDTLDEAAEVLHAIYEKAFTVPEYLRSAPHTTGVSRPDEVKAARTPKIIQKL